MAEVNRPTRIDTPVDDDKPEVSASRPTILVGFGRHGEQVLEHLLKSSAWRGVLSWQETSAAERREERRLQDLALISVADPNDPSHTKRPEIQPDTFDLMEGLFSQIETVDSSEEWALAHAVEAASQRLLNLRSQNPRAGQRTFGLDIIVVAHPAGDHTLGQLTQVLLPMCEQLQNNPNLRPRSQSSRRLNLIQILDFDNLYDSQSQAHSLRRALFEYVGFWERRFKANRAAFGRTYLSDCYGDVTQREEAVRIQETVLFLEFLLFEGMRADGECKRLYERSSNNESPIANFGIRLFERSTGLLSRLAAASFGAAWVTEMSREVHSESALANWRPEHLLAKIDARQLEDGSTAAIEETKQTCAELTVDAEDWPEAVGSAVNHSLNQFDAEVARWVAAQTEAIIHADEDQTWAARIESEIGNALRDHDKPETVGALVCTLRQIEREIASTVAANATPIARKDIESNLSDVHGAFLRHRRQQFQPAGIRRWWPPIVLLGIVGAAPVLRLWLAQTPAPEPGAGIIALNLYRAAMFFAGPLAACTLLLVFLLPIAWWGRRSMEARSQRATEFWTHGERGRLAAELSQFFEPGGHMSTACASIIADGRRRVRLALLWELRRAVAHVLASLHERQRELTWLANHLQNLNRSFGILDPGPHDQDDGPRLSTGPAGALRVNVETFTDYKAIRQRNQATIENFLRTQRNLPQLFSDWNEPYCSSFLDPLRFLDELVRAPETHFRDAYVGERAQFDRGMHQERLRERLSEFVQAQGRFAVGFRWPTGTKTDKARKNAILHEPWLRQSGVTQDILEAGYDKTLPTADHSERAYLLQIVLGAPPQALLHGTKADPPASEQLEAQT